MGSGADAEAAGWVAHGDAGDFFDQVFLAHGPLDHLDDGGEGDVADGAEGRAVFGAAAAGDLGTVGAIGHLDEIGIAFLGQKVGGAVQLFTLLGKDGQYPPHAAGRCEEAEGGAGEGQLGGTQAAHLGSTGASAVEKDGPGSPSAKGIVDVGQEAGELGYGDTGRFIPGGDGVDILAEACLAQEHDQATVAHGFGHLGKEDIQEQRRNPFLFYGCLP